MISVFIYIGINNLWDDFSVLSIIILLFLLLVVPFFIYKFIIIKDLNDYRSNKVYILKDQIQDLQYGADGSMIPSVMIHGDYYDLRRRGEFENLKVGMVVELRLTTCTKQALSLKIIQDESKSKKNKKKS